MICRGSLAEYQGEHVQIDTPRGDIMTTKDTQVLGTMSWTTAAACTEQMFYFQLAGVQRLPLIWQAAVSPYFISRASLALK